MPTYEYGCEACGHGWELEQRISEDPVKKCPKCGKSKARRLISGGNFILKGSGWYADLYHKPAGGSSKKSDGGGGGEKASTSSEASSDPKPPKKTKADAA